MLLVLFALLLVWMLGNKRHGVDRIRQLEAQVGRLQSELSQALGSPAGVNRFDDLFRRLQAAEETTKEIEKKAAALEEDQRQTAESLRQLGVAPSRVLSPDSIAEAKRRLRTASEMLAAAGQAAAGAGFDAQRQRAFLTTLPALMSYHREAERLGYQPQELQSLNSRLLRELDSTRGQLSTALTKLGREGNGLEHPACWATPEGKPEYIFNVALRSGAIVVHDNSLPHRTDDQQRLPISSIRFDVDLSPNEFRQATRELFLWSERQAPACRFFVRVFDLTADHEKGIYKRELRTVGEHFYYYEELIATWGAQ